jgi:hypothetical protein
VGRHRDATQQIAGEEQAMRPHPTRIVLAIVGLFALALFGLGMVQVASSAALSPALVAAIVALGGLLVLIFAWLLLYTDERGVL